MTRNKKKKNNEPSQDSLSEAASGGGGGVLPQQLGNGSPKGKTSFADLQEQSTLHLEADVRSNGMLKSWNRKTLLVTKGVLHVCKNKSDGWSEKKVLLGDQSEVKLVAPDKKNPNRNQLILTGSDKSKVKVGLDSANDQGALAKALEEEGATIAGMESITIYKAFLSSRESRDRSALDNDGSVPAICVTSDDSDAGNVSGNNSFVGRSTDEASNIYGELDNKSLNPACNDLHDGKAVNGALELDDSFYSTLEGDQDGSSHEGSTNEPLYKNSEVKLYKQNLRLKKESEIYDKLDHGYGKQTNLITQATPSRPAPAVKQHIMLNSQKQLSAAESIDGLTEDEDIYETTIQIGQHVSRLNSASIDTSSSSQRPESSQTGEISSEGSQRMHDYDIPSLLSNGEQAKKNTAVFLSVEEAEIVSDEMKDRSGSALESLGEKYGNEGATDQSDVTMKSQVKAFEPNANNCETDQPVTTLESQEEARELNAYDRATGQPETTFGASGEEQQISAENECDDEIYGTIDQETYGALYGKTSETSISSTGILEDSAEKLTEDEGVGIYESIWETSGRSEGSNLQEADCDNHTVNKLIAENQPSDDDCKNGEINSMEYAEIKSDISGETEFSKENKSSLDLQEIPVRIESEVMINKEIRCESQESAIIRSSDDDSEGINTFKQFPDCDNGESNGSQSSLLLKDNDLLNTFVEKVTQIYGPDHVTSMVADSRSDQLNNAEVESSINKSSGETSQLKCSKSSSAADIDEEVQPDVGHDVYEDDLLVYQNDNNGMIQTDDEQDENLNDHCEGFQEEDNNEGVQPDGRRNNHATDHDGSPEEDLNSQSIIKKGINEEYDLSELLGAIADNFSELNTDNNLAPMPNFDEEETKGSGDLLCDATSLPNNVIETASCIADKTSSKKTKKKVRFNDDIQVQCLDDLDDESENDSMFSEGEDNTASETNYSSKTNLNDDSVVMENNFETPKSNTEIQQDSNESTVLSTIQLTKSTSSSKSVENSSATNSNATGSIRRPSISKLQQPSKVVLPALGDGSGRGKTTSSSSILLEPKAGTYLVDYSRGGRLYQTRILKVEDGCLHFFPSPPEKNRRGSYPEPGDDDEAECLTARPVHTVELAKSSVAPILKADGEGLYSVTLTLSGGKTVFLKSQNRDEQMKLVFLLSDEVMRVTSPEDRVGLVLYPSKVKEPSNKLEDKAQLSTSHNVQLSASPIVNSDFGTSSNPSGPPRLLKSVQNESTQPINREPLTKINTEEADRKSEVKVSPDAKLLSDTRNSSEKQFLWQNILKKRTSNIGPESFTNQAVAQSTNPIPSPPTPHSPEESISRSTTSSSGPTKANDRTLMFGTSLKPVNNGVNGVRQNVVPNKFSFSEKQTDDQISLYNSEISPVSQVGNERTHETNVDTPVTETVSKLRSIFEFDSENNDGFHSLPMFRHSFSETHPFTNNNQRRSRPVSLSDVPNRLDQDRRQNMVSPLFNRSLFDCQASVPEEVLGAYARPPSIVIKELRDDSSQAEEDGAGLSVRPWWDSRTGGLRRDSFGAARQAGLGVKPGVTTSVNYSSMTLEAVTEAINPVLQAKRLKMDSMMVVADIRRTRDHLANRALEQWELAQQMDEGQQLEKRLALQQVALLQQELQQLQAALKQEKRHQKWLKKQLKLREKEG